MSEKLPFNPDPNEFPDHFNREEKPKVLKEPWEFLQEVINQGIEQNVKEIYCKLVLDPTNNADYIKNFVTLQIASEIYRGRPSEEREKFFEEPTWKIIVALITVEVEELEKNRTKIMEEYKARIDERNEK